MRTDLASLNPGKACAQATHSANQAVYEARDKIDRLANEDSKRSMELFTLLREWENQTTQGFGTCVVLGAKEAQMRNLILQAQHAGLHANITHDPNYPLLDGETLHLIPLDTCGYVFGRKDKAQEILSGLSLYP
jgi:peptidyl-tRNA hydrolase